jgi:hypothetical protein
MVLVYLNLDALDQTDRADSSTRANRAGGSRTGGEHGGSNDVASSNEEYTSGNGDSARENRKRKGAASAVGAGLLFNSSPYSARVPDPLIGGFSTA